MISNSEGQQNFQIRIQTEQLRRDAQNVIAQFDRIGRGAAQAGHTIDESISSISPKLAEIGAGIAGAFAISKLTAFGQQIIQLRGQIQALETSFSVLTGSRDKGMALFDEIRQFAASTPMMMKDIASGAQTMLAFNIELENVMPMLKAIGDISMGDAQKFQSLTLAFSQMSATGKLMGQDLLQMINAGFNPLAVISEQTGKKIGELKKEMESGAISAEMVAQAFKDAAGEGGKFNGMLAQQAEGINGAMAQLSGAIDNMMNDIGTKAEGVIVDTIHTLEDLVKHYEQVGKVIIGLIATYGTYRAAVMAVTAAKGWATLAEAAHYRWLLMVEKAQKLLNATMLNNPYVLVATLIAGVVTAMMTMKTEADRLREAEEEYEKQKQETIEAEQRHQQELEKLISIAGNESLATDTRREALTQLEKKYPDIFAKYDTEYEKLKNIAEIKKEIAALDAATSLTNPVNELADVERQIKEIEDARRKRQEARDKAQKEREDRSKIKGYGGSAVVYSKQEEAKLQQLQNKKEELLPKVREQEIDNYLTHLDNVSTKIIENEIKARENALAQIELKGGKGRGRIIGGGASGEFTADQLLYQLNKLKAEQNKRNAPKFSGTELKKQAQKEYDEALKAYNELFTSAWKGTKEEQDAEIEKRKAALDKAKKNLDSHKPQKNANASHGKTQAQLNAEVEAAEMKANETRKKRNAQTLRDLEQQELQHQQQLIDLMADGREKIQAQRDLDARKEVVQQKETMRQLLQAVIDGEKAEFEAEEDARAKREAANGNKNYAKRTFRTGGLDVSDLDIDSTVEAAGDLSDEAINQMNEIILWYNDFLANIEEITKREQEKKEAEALDQYLIQFGEYLEKREAMKRNAERQMAQAETEGERMSIAAQLEKDLSEIDIIAKRKISAVTLLFDDMSDKTIKDMEAIYQKGVKTLDFLKAGEWNAEAGEQLGITEETFNTLLRTPEEIERIEKAVKSLKKELDGTKQGFSLMAQGLKEIFKQRNDAKKFQDALSKITTGVGQLTNAASFLSDSIGSMGEALGNDTLQGVADGLSVATEALDSAMQGAQAGAAFGPIGAAAGAALGIVTSLVSAFSKLHDQKYENRINELQDKIDSLEQSYDRLGKAIDKAYSKDAAKLIEQQQKNLRLQQAAIRQQILAERLKKNVDTDRIKDWQKELQEIDDKIKDLEEDAKNAIFGEDIKSAIENFADAYGSMFDEGISKAKASKDLVKNMIKQMIVEAMKGDIKDPMERLRDLMRSYWADNYISEWEQEQLNKYAEGMMGDLEKKYGWADSYFKDSTSQNSSRGGFSTMSQDTADELNGRFTALQMSNETIKIATIDIQADVKGILSRMALMTSSMEEMRGMALIAIDYLETISKHTSHLPQMNDRLRKIEDYTSRI